MAKKANPTQTQTTSMDPATLAYLNRYRGRAQSNFDQSGTPNAYQTEAAQRASQAAGGLDFASQTGLTGLDAYMNPYQNDVVAGVNSDFDRQDAMGANAAADQATKANAFGGDRAAILQAENSRNVNQNRASTLAGVRSSGFENAVQQLFADRGMQGQLGQAGMQGLFGLGSQMDQNQLGALAAMQGGMTPGTTTATTETHTPSNPFGSILGLAGMIPGIGQGIGTIRGLFGGGKK